MQKTITSIFKILPGVAVSLTIATVSVFLESLIPVHLIGGSVIALFIGMFLNSRNLPKKLNAGIKFTSKRVLKFAIILLGASLSITTVVTVGKISLTIMCFTLLTCFGGGYFIGKALKLKWKISNLISAGTGICGGSAIAAIGPVIDAEDKDIAFAMSATFLFDMVMILLFPLLGRYMGLSDMAYGLWAGTAVNDTSSVVAAGYAFSEAAGDFATMVKLTRTLSIIPVVIIFALININLKRRESVNSTDSASIGEKVKLKSIVPWFILGFLALALASSLGFIPTSFSIIAKNASRFLMVAALAAIGLNTSFSEMKKSGAAPMLHGFIVSALVVIVALTVEYFMGIL